MEIKSSLLLCIHSLLLCINSLQDLLHSPLGFAIHSIQGLDAFDSITCHSFFSGPTALKCRICLPFTSGLAASNSWKVDGWMHACNECMHGLNNWLIIWFVVGWTNGRMDWLINWVIYEFVSEWVSEWLWRIHPSNTVPLLRCTELTCWSVYTINHYIPWENSWVSSYIAFLTG